jgi:hypothetical protein
MVRGFVLGSLVNGAVFAQILYYGSEGRQKAKEKAKKADEKKKE